MDAPIVTSCPTCGVAFTLDQLMESADVEPVGMQFVDPDHQYNMFFFNHACAGCGTTFTVPVEEFLSCITEPVPDLARTGMEDCGRHCLRVTDLAACAAPCRYAPFRRLLLRMLAAQAGRRPKTDAA
jgi:hypothetical protein